MNWRLTKRSDPAVLALRDRHYSCKRPGGKTAGAPGRVVVLRTVAGDAAWITHWPDADKAQHAFGDVWMCSLFRNEGPLLSSALVREGVAATAAEWGLLPATSFPFITFVDEERVRRKRDPGRCFRKAGFVPIGRTKDRDLLVLGLPHRAFPAAESAPVWLWLEGEAA